MIKNILRSIVLAVFSFVVVLSIVATDVSLIQPPKPLVQVPVVPQIPINVFETHIDAFIAQAASNLLNNKISQTSSLFAPYARILKVNPEDEICFMGDIHGSIDAVNNNIQELIAKDYLDSNLTIKKKNFFMVFLGDYVDRVLDGVPVWEKLLQLHENNPNNVILLAGNHESLTLNSWGGGFIGELRKRYGSNQALLDKLAILYSTLPTVLFIVAGKKVIQCCHGGFDLKFNVLEAVKDAIKNNTNIVAIADYRKGNFLVTTSYNKAMEMLAPGDFRNWFTWIDFYAEKKSSWTIGRGIKLGTVATKKYLEVMSDADLALTCIIRGHQHYKKGLKLLGKSGEPQDFRAIISKDSNNNDLKARSKEAYVCSTLPFSALGNVLTFSTATAPMPGGFCLCDDNCFGILSFGAKAVKDIWPYESSWTLSLYEKRVHGV